MLSLEVDLFSHGADRKVFKIGLKAWKALQFALDAPVRQMPRMAVLLREPGFFDCAQADMDPRAELYSTLQMAAATMRGSWWQRIGQAETRRSTFRGELEECGLWSRCAAEPWLGSFLGEGAARAPWLDETTLNWHAERSLDPAWSAELSRRKRPLARALADLRVILAWAIAYPIGKLAVKANRKP